MRSLGLPVEKRVVAPSAAGGSMLLLWGQAWFIPQPHTEVWTAPHRSFVFPSRRWERPTSRQRIQLIGGVVQAGVVKHPNPLNDKAFEERWGQGTHEIYWATNSCMDLKSKCNHYRWESLDVTKSSYLEPFKSRLADRCFKQRNKSIQNWKRTLSWTINIEAALVCCCSFKIIFCSSHLYVLCPSSSFMNSGAKYPQMNGHLSTVVSFPQYKTIVCSKRVPCNSVGMTLKLNNCSEASDSSGQVWLQSFHCCFCQTNSSCRSAL